MTKPGLLQELADLGEESVRKRYRKDGAGDDTYGVKLGELRKIAKRVKANPALALELWATGNVDARLLAILLMKPNKLSADQVAEMVGSVRITQVADWLSAYVLKKHPDKEALRVRFMAGTDPWVARAGWSLTNERVCKSPGGLDLSGLLDRIEAEAPSASPQAQWTMNFVLAEIGIRNPEHRNRALALGETLGLFRDYPTPKGCTSPFAPLWIAEMVRRQG